jgi:hypothetical protein
VRRRTRNIAPRRFDHVFASVPMRPIACNYRHDLRQRGLSDRTAIEAVFVRDSWHHRESEA